MKRVNFYAAIREMRECIVKAMQERGITELAMYKPYREWGREQGYKPEDYEEDADEDYDFQDYRDQEAPYVVFFDKWSNGTDYRVDRVTLALKVREGCSPVLEFDCYANEQGSEVLGENDVMFLTLYNVYDKMMDLLGIGDDGEDVESLASAYNGLPDAQKDEFLRLTGNQ